MELQHSFTVPADVEKAWATLLDLEGVAPCFPGATLTGQNGEEFSGQVKVKLGPVSLQYAGKGRFVEKDDADHRAVIEAHGSDRRGNGTAGATVVAHLEPEGDDVTRVKVVTQLKVTGRPAQFGRGVMQDVGSRIVDQFATSLARKLAGDTEPPSAPAPTAAEPEASAAAAAAVTAEPAATVTTEPTAVTGTGNGAGSRTVTVNAAPTTAAAEPVPSPPAAAAPSQPVGEASAAISSTTKTATAPRPAAPRPTQVSRSAPEPASELDLNAVVLPVLAKQYGPTLIAVLITAVITWIVARRRH